MTEKQDAPKHGVTQMEIDHRREFLKRASALTVAGVSGHAMAQGLLPPFTVGTQGFATLQGAFNAVADGGIVQAQGTIVSQAALLTKNNVTLKGPAIFATQGANYGGKAVIVQVGNKFTVEDIEAFGMAVSDGNGAFIRLEGSGLTMRRTNVHDGQQGILTNGRADSDILLEDAIFERLGDGSGQSHGIYVSADRSLTIIRGKYNDAYNGHCIKSRAVKTTITGAEIHEGRASRAVDVPNGGVVEIAACDILQTQETDNSNIIGYGMEPWNGVHAVNEFYFRASNKVVDLRDPKGPVFQFGFEPDVKVIEEALPPGPAPVQPAFELNINHGAWRGWADTWRVNMEYSNAHQHTDGSQLEFAWAQHSRQPGDHTSVRRTKFTADGPPKQSYLWPENDDRIWESDNHATFYLPWRQWVYGFHFKVIDIGARPPVAILRFESNVAAQAGHDTGRGLDNSAVLDISMTGFTDTALVNSNYNPACIVNPDPKDPWTGSFGGGYFTNSIGAKPSVFRLVDDNPNPATKERQPIRMRAFAYSTSIPSPQYTRHAVIVGPWLYWGGCGQRDDFTKCDQFFRIYTPDLKKQVLTQERITDAPNSPVFLSGSRFPLLAADVRRKRLIFINGEGVFLYQIPDDGGNDGVWTGPFSVPNWASVMSGGRADGISGDWAGFIGTHHAGLNQTFFRYNDSREWHRIRWGEAIG